MDRSSDKAGSRQDDALKHDTEGLVRGGHATHAEDWKSSEPAGEDQPDVTLAPDETRRGGTPAGMTTADVEGRSELASYIGRAEYPTVRTRLLELAMERNAPDRVVERIRALPGGRSYENIQDVWVTLGGGVERQRT